MRIVRKVWAKYKGLLQGKGCLVTGILVIIPFLFLCCFSTFGFFAVDTGLRSAGVLPTYTSTVPATGTALPTHTPSATNTPAPTDTPTPTSTSTPSPTDTPTLTPTYTSTPHPTDTASPTPEPSPTEQPPTDTPTPAPTATPTEVLDTGEAEVHVVDVGQGDALLIRGPGGETVLVDGGGSGSGIVQYVRAQGVERLDLVVATHPHADHIGGLVDVLQAMPVEEVVTNGVPHTTLTYERFLDAIFAAGAVYTEVGRGDTLEVGSLLFDVVHPPAGFGGGLNDQSIVLRFAHGDVGFLFIGDAERAAESSMLASGQNLSATVLKVGHHGSRTSSSPRFLQQVQPEVAIYSCGRGNPYGHPHAETLADLANIGAEIYGTDVNGTVVVTSGGTSYTVSAAREGDPALPAEEPTQTPESTTKPTDPPPVEDCPYIGNANTGKFHRAGCFSIDQMAEHNKVCLQSREDAIAQGYDPCGHCNP